MRLGQSRLSLLVLQYFIQFREWRSLVRGGKPVKGKIDWEDVGREKTDRCGKPISVDLEAEKVEPLLVVEPPPIVKAEKVKPPPVVKEAGCRSREGWAFTGRRRSQFAMNNRPLSLHRSWSCWSSKVGSGWSGVGSSGSLNWVF
jgi:hypothetical protein